MKYFVVVILMMGNVAMAQSRYDVDPYGHKITPARISSEIEKRTVRLGEMEDGERVQVFPEAMVVDDSGQCWLNPNYLAFPMKYKAELEITKNKLGYIVRVNYKYDKSYRGYAVPYWHKWERGYVPRGYIPVKALVIDKPNYGKLSPSQEITRQLQQPYNPRYNIPKVPTNPYSLEKENVQTRPRPSVSSGKPSPSTREFILPEIFSDN